MRAELTTELGALWDALLELAQAVCVTVLMWDLLKRTKAQTEDTRHWYGLKRKFALKRKGRKPPL